MGILALGSRRLGCILTGIFCAAVSGCAAPDGAVGGLPPLTAQAGDPVRGHQIVTGREANCLFCHAIPDASQRFMGNVGPPLAGIARRLDPRGIRLRIVDPTRLNPEAVMPAYHRIDGLDNVAHAYKGKPILSAQEVEDVVAYLMTLQ